MSPDAAVVNLLLDWIDVLMRHSMPDLLTFAKENDLSMSHSGPGFPMQK